MALLLTFQTPDALHKAGVAPIHHQVLWNALHPPAPLDSGLAGLLDSLDLRSKYGRMFAEGAMTLALLQRCGHNELSALGIVAFGDRMRILDSLQESPPPYKM